MRVFGSTRDTTSQRPARAVEPPLPDRRLIAGTRLVLAASGLSIVWLVPSEPNRWVDLTYSILVLHTLYALCVYVLQLRESGSRLMTMIQGYGHWVDVGWYTLLITLSSGTNSIFFFGYFFCIVVAAFRWGFAAGIRVTLASAALFTTCGYAAAPDPPEFERQRFLIRPVYLLALGYVVASRGGLELKLRRQLRFLKDVGTVSNPRFGVDRTVGLLMHRLIELYRVDGCAFVTRDRATHEAKLRRARREEPEGPVPAVPVPEDLAQLFLRFPEGVAVGFSSPARVRLWPVAWAPDAAREAGKIWLEAGIDACKAVADTLDAESFLTVPVRTRYQISGRCYLFSREKHAFDEQDAQFLVQALEHAFPLIENIRLVDQLASRSAEEERRKIARDIHDSVIQPYVGLQIGLAALRERLLTKDANVGGEIERLMEMTSAGIAELRRQVFGLREAGAPDGTLVPAVVRFAQKFAEATGIAVQVATDGVVAVNDRVAAEAFQLVAEGLSNVRRHTQSQQAVVHLGSAGGQLTLRIENEGPGPEPATCFEPRSILERVEALGGRVAVSRRSDGGAVVSIEIPL